MYAARGLGCFCNGAPVTVNERAELNGSYVMTSGFDAWTDDAYLAAEQAGLNLRTWGDGYGYVLVATGRVEAMYDPVAELYDLAPIPVIIERGRRPVHRPHGWAERRRPATVSPPTDGSTTSC